MEEWSEVQEENVEITSGIEPLPISLMAELNTKNVNTVILQRNGLLEDDLDDDE